MKLTTMALRNIFRNGHRSLLSGLAIGISACAITFIYAFNNGMLDDLKWNIASYETGQVRIRHADFGKYERLNPMHLNVPRAESLTGALKDYPETDQVSARIPFPGRIYRKGEHFNTLGLGVDFQTETKFMDMVPEDSRRSLRGYSGTLPRAGENEALVGEGLAEKMGIGIGDKITILTQTASRGSNGMTFRVTGLVRFQHGAMTGSVVLIPLDRVRYFLRMDDAVMEILIKTVPGTDNAAFAAKLAARFGSREETPLEVLPWEKIGTTLSLFSMVDIIYMIMSLFFLVLGSTVIINTTMMVIFERTREIGTMAALGMTPGNIVNLFFLESLVIGFVGALSGVLIGSAASLLTGHFGINFGDMFEGMDFEMSSVIYPRLDIPTTLIIFGSAFFLSGLATFFPSLKAARVQPMEALRTD